MEYWSQNRKLVIKGILEIISFMEGVLSRFYKINKNFRESMKKVWKEMEFIKIHRLNIKENLKMGKWKERVRYV